MKLRLTLDRSFGAALRAKINMDSWVLGGAGQFGLVGRGAGLRGTMRPLWGHVNKRETCVGSCTRSCVGIVPHQKKYTSKHPRLYIDMNREIHPPVLVLGHYGLLLPLISILSA